MRFCSHKMPHISKGQCVVRWKTDLCVAKRIPYILKQHVCVYRSSPPYRWWVRSDNTNPITAAYYSLWAKLNKFCPLILKLAVLFLIVGKCPWMVASANIWVFVIWRCTMITSVFICENARGCETEKYLGSKHSGLNWTSLILGKKTSV